MILVDQFGFIEETISKRMLKICDNLAQVENRSYVILGRFPLTAGSLTSVSFHLIV